ncbi:MAG: PAS domain S-box protein [Phycisphaerae bacterium]|nr:PAS domain S-box protein [Phycisphaerae bacterium]
MGDPVLKPWSLCEEEMETSAVEPQALPSIELDAEGWGGASLRKWPTIPKISPYWALGGLVASISWCMWGYIRSGRQGLSSGDTMVVFSLLVVSAVVMAISGLMRRVALQRMVEAIRRGLTIDRETGKQVQSSELGVVWRAVEEHSANIQRRLAELADAHGQASLELTLAAAQRRLSSIIFSAMPDPLMVLDSYGQLIQANTAAENVFGFQCEESLRSPIDSIIVHDEMRKLIRQSREAEQRVAERRAEFLVGDKFYGVHVIPLALGVKAAEGASDHGLIVNLRDITREREASRKKSEFVAHVAHELRTPLSSIRAYVEMLVDGEAADEATRREYYDIIQTSAQRLGRLIDNMLNISRIEAGTVRINKEPIAISMVVKEACDVMRPSAEEKKITLTEQLTPVMFRILADRDLLYQAILNLISNAVKYTPEGGEVVVRMSPREEQKTILIEVQDTGVGIPKEDLPRMFQKFFRVEANKNMAKGTGLGLNLVKSIVESVHGGQITLASEIGKGSTFGMIFPLMS